MIARRASVAATALLLVSCSLQPIDLTARKPLALRTTIRAAGGSRLARIYKPAANRKLIPLSRVPQPLQDAVLAAEDARFYEHPGYDLRSIARAALENLEEGEIVQGGSTITQQYVKNVYFRKPERTFERKARELRIAIELERTYSKRHILNLYLNTVYLGEGAYGIGAAAETYFRRPVRDLRLARSALLAALIKAPAIYNPRDHPGRALERRNYVLGRMAELGMISRARARRATRSGLGVTAKPPRLSWREPYFVEAVKRELLDEPLLGVTPNERANNLYRGGLDVETTLVPRLQRAAEEAVARTLNQRGDPGAALVAIEPASGRIVAMVGGRDWNESQVNLALGAEGGGSGRQPGSSFKPIAAAAALETGASIDRLYESAPGVFRLADGSTWAVSNAEGGGSEVVSIYDALVDSINGVFARLSLDIGPDRIATQAALMGVRSELPHYPSIALGAAEVSVLDMATAYATIANGGTYVEPSTIERITFRDGRASTPLREEVPEVIAGGNVYLLNEALQDVVTEGTGQLAYFGRPVAGKTGTTDDYADAWFVGYTPDLVAAVWVGYPQGRVPMTNVHGITVFGGTFPAIIWREFMKVATRDTPARGFDFPRDDIVKVEIDPETGLLAAPWCPGPKQRLLVRFVPGTVCRPEPVVAPDPADSPVPGVTRPDRKGERSGAEPKKDRGPTPSGEPSPEPTS